MARRVRSLLLTALCAVIGAVIGRLVLEARRRRDAGLDPMGLRPGDVTVRAQDLVPGLVAAYRVQDQPWSWLHVPGWLAAFSVNLTVAAVGGDLSTLRDAATRALSGALGVDFDDPFGLKSDVIDVEPVESSAATEPPAQAASGSPAGARPTADAESRPAAPGGFTAFEA